MDEYDSEYIRKSRRRKQQKRKRRRHITFMIIGDLLLIGVILCTFAAFHHVIPRMRAKPSQTQSETVQPAPVSMSETTAAPVEEVTAPADNETPDEPDPEVIEGPADTRTEWQIRFEDKFTDEVVISDMSYSSPNLSISIERFDEIRDGYPVTYYLADIYIGSIDCLRTGAAYGDPTGTSSEDAMLIAKREGAILQINGDFAGVWKGFMIRNGTVYSTEPSEEDICVVYKDGSIKTYSAAGYDIDEIIADDPYQNWRFGPQLLDENGAPLSKFNTTWAIANFNPRAGIGYYEPGHYCLLLAEGRTNTSRGLTMTGMAQIFADLGCVSAYNLDGGASAVMIFNDKQITLQSTYRELLDTVYFAEPPVSAAISQEAN